MNPLNTSKPLRHERERARANERLDESGQRDTNGPSDGSHRGTDHPSTVVAGGGSGRARRRRGRGRRGGRAGGRARGTSGGGGGARRAARGGEGDRGDGVARGSATLLELCNRVSCHGGQLGELTDGDGDEDEDEDEVSEGREEILAVKTFLHRGQGGGVEADGALKAAGEGLGDGVGAQAVQVCAARLRTYGDQHGRFGVEVRGEYGLTPREV